MDYSENFLTGQQIELSLLQKMGLVQSSSTSRVSWHAHSGFEILFLLDGRTAYEFKHGDAVELQGGQFLVVPPEAVHRGKHDVRAPCRICGLTLAPLAKNAERNSLFTRTDVAHIQAAFARSARTIHPISPPLRWLIRRLMDEFNERRTPPNDQFSSAILRALITTTILEAVRQILYPPQAPQAIVAAAAAYLGSRYHEPLSIGQLAAHLGYSRSRVHELFKSETGLSPNDYLQRVRVEQAQKLLRSTQKSLTAIALEVGFNSGAYFSTVFRRYTGVTPANYRKSFA